MEKKEKTVKEKKTTRSLPLSGSNATSAVVDVSSIHSHLQKLIPEVEKKKTKDMSNWSYLRPYMSFDFVDDNSSVRPPPISVIPWQSQENILLDDLLSVLEGFQGKYIVAQRVTSSYSPRTFIVADSIEPTLRHLVQQILPLASDHSIVIRFIQEKRQLKWGRVNQALASAMNSFISDYTVFIAQLESLLRKNQLTLQNIWFYLQSTIQTFQVLAKIANSINESEAIGGQTLTILHEETMHYITDNNAQKLCMFLIGEASIPYFESLQRWLHKGIVFDPYMEFLIMDNVEEEADANKVTGLYSDSYWSKRYTICNKNVPVFLNVVQEIILRTGRYLNVVRQCSETTRSSADFAVPPVEKLVYTLHGEQYLPIIEKAYQFASSTLLDLLLTKYDIINRIKSLKRYFLMEQGDFIVQLLDLCEEELVKPISEVVPSRLQSLFELALRTSTGKHDPYKEDVTLTILTENNTYQIFTIHSICNESKEENSI
ncbi:Gamma-tubulin complex component 2 [Homalodisca vitripennis]|nr:Gamma-tubulin complex component 2 [Homalodisca vitripennis]